MGAERTGAVASLDDAPPSPPPRDLTRPVREAVANAVGSIVRPKIAKLCILTTGRTGSDLLVELLDAHPQLRCEKEVLGVPHRDARRFIRGRIAVARSRGAAAYGFKINSLNVRVASHRWTLPTLIAALAADGFRFVRLRRANLLRQAVSAMRAGQTREYHATAPVTTGAMHLDPLHAIYLMRTFEVYEDMLDGSTSGCTVLPISYEDDLEDEDARTDALSRIFRFIGLEPVASAPTRLQRTTPRALADAVANHEELTAILRGTRFERFLLD
jgi:hypothetical protein